MQRSSLPLHGVKVIDFGQYIAGPAVAMILGDLGATVVRIEPPSGPLWDSPANATLNRNKLIVTVDLKTEKGLDEAISLIKNADVVVENFRPGVLAKLGIDFAALRRADPGLITVSIPGYASDDQLRRDWRAFESVVAASSGLFTSGILGGLGRVLMGVNPTFTPLPLASAYGTMLAVTAAVLVLQSRERTGTGDHIEVPLASALTEGLGYNSLTIENLPSRYVWAGEKEIVRRKAAGLPLNLSYDEIQKYMDPFARHYKCQDGQMIYLCCTGHLQHTKRCLQILGLYEELVQDGLPEEADTFIPLKDWKSGFSVGAFPVPQDWAEKIAALIEPVFATRTAGEWDRLFGEGGVPATTNRWLKDWISGEHTQLTGLVIEVDDPEYGRMKQPGAVAWLEESGEATLAPQPRRWVEFSEALAALNKGTPREKSSSSRPVNGSRSWLEGVKVLDLCNVIAGPESGAYLARFGADVIKLDATKSHYDSLFTIVYSLNNMRGKRSVLVDIRSEGGRDVFEKLVKSVDVVIWNATDRQVKNTGLDLESLRAINPKAIFCQLDCYSGVRPGPRSDYRGYDNLVQAATGITLRFAGRADQPEDHAPAAGTLDVNGGLGAALAIAAALYQKYRTGLVGRARTSLSAVSGLVQLPFFYDYEGRAPFNEPGGVDAKGFNPLSSLYETADGRTLMLNASDKDLARLNKVKGLEGLSDVPAQARGQHLKEVFAEGTAEVWISKLRAADVGAAVCQRMDEIRSSNSRPADGDSGIRKGSYSFSVFHDHPCGHVITQVDPYAIRPILGTIHAFPPPEKYGASTTSILRQLGYSNEQIDSMLATGAVSNSWSDEYLPS
ncbi:CoA transferase [Pseudomonas fluorescens]|nr:CoA transferase [Pseudomonas fluorescens]